MSFNFEKIFPEASQVSQTCICCNKTGLWRGWADLCDRSCYHDFCALLNSFNEGAEPDSRLVAYFKKHPEPIHWFNSEKILTYIKNMD